MPLGSGRYGELCTEIRQRTKAAGVILIVIAGEKGEGFECQLPAGIAPQMPRILREMADKIEAAG